MLQRLPIALVQIKASSNSESLLNNFYSLFQSKEITRKVYNKV